MLVIAYTVFLFASFLLGYLIIIFLLSRLFRDNGIMDIAYGPGFAVAGYATLSATDTTAPLPIIIFICMCLWALRLSLRIFFKNWNHPEDARYAAWREAWMKRGYRYFLIRSFVQIQLLQGAIMVVVALPFILAVAAGEALLLPFVIGGLALFCTGLAIETISDYQLDDFIRRKRDGTETAPLMKQGLFRYSRRPNYFGETLVWWGLAFTTASLPLGIIAFASPLLITYIVTQVTGPMLEKIFLERYPDAYRQYMLETNYFIPGPPRL